MQRSALRQEIARYRKLLAGMTDEIARAALEELLQAARRQLAQVEARLCGARTSYPPLAVPTRDAQRLGHGFQDAFGASDGLYLLLDPRPGLHIVDVNPAYARATLIVRVQVAGQPLFEIFPDNPHDRTADGVANLFDSLCLAAETGRPHAMATQRYDIRDPTGRWLERHWRPRNTPLFDDAGRLAFLLHHVEDATAAVLGRPPRRASA